MSEAAVVAAGIGQVRRYLGALGMPEDDISGYLQQSRRGPGPAVFSFSGDRGDAYEYWLTCDDAEFVLSRQDEQAR